MNNENIVLIIGFVIILINVIVSAIIFLYLLPKRNTYNSSFNNNNYNAEQIKELLNKLCKIIFKYIDGDINKLCEDDKTIVLDALDL